MFNYFHNKSKKSVAGTLLGIQLTLLLVTPINTAYAVAVYPGTPEGASVTNNVCMVARQGGGFFANRYCYPTMAACSAAWGSVPFIDQATNCFDNATNVSWAEAMWKGMSPTAIAGNAKEAVLSEASKLLAEGIAFVANMINRGAALFLKITAYILDTAIARTIDSATYTDLTAVKVGWTAVRDFSNMFFIFVLLYIAILTILGMAGSNAKRWVAHLIIAALLINFSLFATQVVIDAGNVLAVGFWSNIQTQQGASTGSSAAAKLMEGFKIQSIYNVADAVNASAPAPKMDGYQRAMVDLGGALLMFVAGYVFLAGAIMMIIRTVTLLICMIVSPFAFLGFALPKGGGFASQWLDKLIGATFVAPAFIFMLYLISIIVTSNDMTKWTGSGSANIGAALGGAPDNFSILYQFAIMIILMLSALTVAQKVGNGVGASAGGWAKAAIGGGAVAALGGGAVLARNLGGKQLGQYLSTKDNVYARRMGNAMKDGSWDVRGTKSGKMVLDNTLGKVGIKTGTANKSGLEKRTARQKEVIEAAEKLHPGDAVAQKNYINQKLGSSMEAKREVVGLDARGEPIYKTKYESTLAMDTKPLKEHKKKLDRNAREQATKRDLDGIIAGTTTPGIIPPALRGAAWDAHVGAVVGRAQPQDIVENVSMIIDKKVSPPIARAGIVRHLKESQLAALGTASHEIVSDETIHLIRNEISASGTPAQQAWLAKVVAKNPTSRWA